MNWSAINCTKRILLQLQREIESVWLVGSTARGDDTADSDIDIMIQPKQAYAEGFTSRLRDNVPSGERVDSLSTYGGRRKNGVGGRLHFIIVNRGEELLFPERISLAA